MARVSVTNNGKGPRVIRNAAGNDVTIPKGGVVEVEVTDGTLVSLRMGNTYLVREIDPLDHDQSGKKGGVKKLDPLPDDLDGLTRAELDELAKKRGVDVAEAKNKGDVIAALQLSVEQA